MPKHRPREPAPHRFWSVSRLLSPRSCSSARRFATVCSNSSHFSAYTASASNCARCGSPAFRASKASTSSRFLSSRCIILRLLDELQTPAFSRDRPKPGARSPGTCRAVLLSKQSVPAQRAACGPERPVSVVSFECPCICSTGTRVDSHASCYLAPPQAPVISSTTNQLYAPIIPSAIVFLHYLQVTHYTRVSVLTSDLLIT